RHPAAERNEPTKTRQINGLIENRGVEPGHDAPDRNVPNTAPTLPATASSTKPSQDPTAARRLDLPAPRRSHPGALGCTLPDTSPAALLSPSAGTKQTREQAPDPQIGLRARC
ncbi:MAG: hypothetical protein ACREJ5_28845, partial [Geminicoccaceae bacterium]